MNIFKKNFISGYKLSYLFKESIHKKYNLKGSIIEKII